MLSLCSVVLSAGLAVTTAAIPTIPTLQPAGPRTNGIVATADGTVYFVDSFRNTVWRVGADGVPVAFVAGRNGRSLQIDADGSIYGMHQGDGGALTLWRADASGRVTEVGRLAVPQQYGHSFLIGGNDSVIGFSGTGKRSGVQLWRASQRERQVIAGGEWGFRDGAAADARFFPIGGMTRSAAGELLVTSGATVRRVAADGRVTTVIANERLLEPKHSFLTRLVGDVQGHLSGITTGADGDIYVANPSRATVVRIDRAGVASVVATSTGGWSPTGVAVSNGVLYVLEYGPGVRVRRIAGDGAVHVLAQLRPQPRPMVVAGVARQLRGDS